MRSRSFLSHNSPYSPSATLHSISFLRSRHPSRSMPSSSYVLLLLLLILLVGVECCCVHGGQVKFDSRKLTKFIDPLPLPSVAVPLPSSSPPPSHCSKLPSPPSPHCPSTHGVVDPKLPRYELTMQDTLQQLHSELPPTRVYGYSANGRPPSYPGPTIEARSEQPIQIHFINKLPIEHILPVDATIMPTPALQSELLATQSRAVVHVHGGHTLSSSDGLPDQWFTRDAAEAGPGPSGQEMCYDLSQPAAMLLYHDHALGVTRLNVWAGLLGLFIIRDAKEESLHLPAGEFEIPLVMQDKSFHPDGSLFYPDGSPDITDPVPSIVPEAFGDAALVNGKVWPTLQVKPQLYRLRLVNGANARFFNVQLFEYDTVKKKVLLDSPGPSWLQIGGDQGLLPAAVPIAGRVLLGPAERADMIVDFSDKKFAGKSFLLHNNAAAPFMSLDQLPDPLTALPDIMLITVDVGRTNCNSRQKKKPLKLKPFKLLTAADACVSRDITLTETADSFDRLVLQLNRLPFDAAATELPRLNTVERWNFINLTPDTHPMHVHLVRFAVVQRRPFKRDVFQAMLDAAALPGGKPAPTTDSPLFPWDGVALPNDKSDSGYKDTVKAPPALVTSIVARFDLPGEYVYHCHILEHEV